MTDKENTLKENTLEEAAEVEVSVAESDEQVDVEAELTSDRAVNGAAVEEATVDDGDLANYVEAMVFSSASPIQSAKLSQALGLNGIGRIKKSIATLNESYEASGRAFRIRQVAGGYQYYVLPQWSDCLKKLFTKTRKIRLTKAALETMAIVAYKQPVSKNQIEFIRGVASDGVLHNLLEKNLVRISGRAEGAGRSLLYSATDEFLKFFGLNTFDDLPRIAEIEELIQNMESERADSMPESDDTAGEGRDAVTEAIADASDEEDALDAMIVVSAEVTEEVVEEVAETIPAEQA